MIKKSWNQTRPTFRILIYLIVLLLMILLFGVYAGTQQENVSAAVVQAYARSATSPVIFVTIDGKDPGNSFIKRFQNSKVLVRKESQGILYNTRYGRGWGTYYVDKATGQKGPPFGIREINWRGPFIAKVEVSHPGYGERFIVVLRLRGWTVTRKEQTWII